MGTGQISTATGVMHTRYGNGAAQKQADVCASGPVAYTLCAH